MTPERERQLKHINNKLQSLFKLRKAQIISSQRYRELCHPYVIQRNKILNGN